MQILVDTRLLCRGGTSGIEGYTRNLIRELLVIDTGNEYSFFYNGLRKEPLEIAAVAALPRNDNKGIRDDRVIDWHIPNKILDAGVRFLGWPAIDRLIKTDLVFSPHFNILKTAATPRVITFHDLSFLNHPQFFSRKQRFWHWMQDVKKQARAAAKIIAVSEFTKNDLVNLLGIAPEKVEVVYSGIAQEFTQPVILSGSEESLRDPSVSPQDDRKREIAAVAALPRNDRPYTLYPKPYILYLGTLEPRKNVPALIRAFNLLKQKPAFKDWQLVLAGRPGWLYQNILREARRSPFRNDIVFTGAVKPVERVVLYNSARVFVYPSFFEGFGFPPLEAQACGCPVVAADRTSLPEVLGESALLISPWKIGDLAMAIEEVALNQKTRNRLIAAGRKNAARFSWAKTAAATLKVFENAR